ncbi:MAG TPA: TMEM175 family protein, partial [Ktedonobacteraceae bacterium]|nr:TMEM175 family protein [Ktedonobacteraceae bacterium]
MDSVEKQPVQQSAQANVPQKDPPIVAKTNIEQPARENVPGAERLLVLCDGIFAIATTLLVIDIKIPSHLSEADFNKALSTTLFQQALIYLITFVVIASF